MNLAGLREELAGELSVPDSPRYEAVRRPANPGYRDVHPRLVIRCGSVADVALGIGYGRDTGIPVVPRGGVTASRVGPPPTGSCSTWPVSTASRWQMTGSRRLVPAPAWRRCTPRCSGTDGPFRLAAAPPCLPVDRTGAGAVSLTLRQAEFGTTGTGEFVVCDGKVAIA